jgi:3-deoxy-D-manno-octulosonic-acid transferase
VLAAIGWRLYECLLILGLCAYLPKALWRRRLPHRDWSMRLGRYPAEVAKRLQGRQTIWVHAVSVGEVLAARPLLQELARQHPGDPLVLSAITPGGFELASKQVGETGAAVYFPLDLQGCVARALDALRPRVLLLMESELWPAVIRLSRARGVPVAVVNGRVSVRTFRRSLAMKPWLRGVLGGVDRFLMQSQTDADRIVQMGAPAERVHVTGNLKWDASLSTRPSPELIRETEERLGLDGTEPVIVAGSTHRGEERAVLHAFRGIRGFHRTARLILAPRHLERLSEVEGLIRESGLRLLRLSQAERTVSWDVGLVDTFGQLPRYYGVGSIVFIGGSLIPHGGQNPLEAASLGKPVLFGPSMDNFSTIAHELLGSHAALQVADGRELAQLFEELLDNAAQAQAIGRRAQELTERFQGATQRTLEALQPLLSGNSKHQIPSSK